MSKWEQGVGPEDSLLFDVVATIAPCEDEDTEDGEVACLIELTERG